MPLLTAQGDAILDSRAYALEQQLWEFDSRLQLVYKVIEHPQRRGVKGRRYEVWRHNENGSDSMIGHWKLDEFDRIYVDIQAMAASAAGRTESVIDSIDKANAEVDDRNRREFEDAYGRLTDHKLSLVRDEGHRTRFGYGGT